MLTLGWIAGLVRHRAARLIAIAGGIAIAVALLASLGVFLATAKATMTQRSIQRVAVDWQVQAQPGADPAAVEAGVRADPHVVTALPVGYATSTALASTADGSAQTTGAARVLGLPDGYADTYPGELRPLSGSGRGVLLAQQTASNLHAVPGSRVTIRRAGLPDAAVTVDGIVDLPAMDSLFQKVGAPAGAQPQAPPDNVLLLPAAQWHPLFDPLATQRPDLVHTQVHARIRHDLPADPAAAYTRVTGSAHHLEVNLTGAGLVGDNLGAVLSSARSDARYADVLFLFLGLPGAVVAALLTAAVTASGAVRRRREQALLRARGASTRHLLRLAAAEAALVGVAGAVIGLIVAAVIARFGFGTALGAASAATIAGWAGVAAVLGLVIAVATVVVPAYRDLSVTTVAGARQAVGRTRRPPAWMRYGLDGLLLLGSAAILWATSSNGYQLVLAPEGVPTISVNYWAFLGPALLWAGGALLAWRLAYLLLTRGRRLTARLLRPVAGALSGTAAATLARGHRQAARTVVFIALAGAFAASTAVFAATYRHQAEADAQLTNGADVTVSRPAGAPADISRVPGVASVEPMAHRFAYVGPDLQDMYGIRADRIADHVTLQDAYFAGGTARDMLHRLASRPDAVLVSAETAKDFQLSPGDTLRLRLPSARTGQPVTVEFHYAGVVKEFPTAPTDSFLVANAGYLAQQVGDDAPVTLLVKTAAGAHPADVASRLRAQLGGTARITDIESTRRVVGSSLSAVDLSTLTRVELGFALALIAATAGLLLVLGFAERRRTFALASALGARSRQLANLVWAEVAVVGVAGLVLGAILGAVLSRMLTAILTGVFDPPPDRLTVPWPYLIGVAALGVACLVLAGAATVAATRRPAMTVLRDL
ncbi:MAG TPA: FtsX-like permease family protein [Planosporangium sp.]|jgi:putative ABC transport system permease protein|nr:FtsX-like permease family protein [Planosporangium sp.]